MSHNITAIIGHKRTVERLLGTSADGAIMVELNIELVIAPLGEEQIDRLTKLKPGTYSHGFAYLSSALEAALQDAGEGHPIAYIETNYFGGSGGQGAAVFSGEGAVLRLAHVASEQCATSSDPINSALRAIGVQATGGRDEFDTVGLGRFRSMASLGIAED